MASPPTATKCCRPRCSTASSRNFETGYTPREDFERARASAREEPHRDAVMDTQMCIDRLRGAGPVFMIGYCYGGTVVLGRGLPRIGPGRGLGLLRPGIKDLLAETPKCPTILHFGALDKGIPLSDVEKIKKAHPRSALLRL